MTVRTAPCDWPLITCPDDPDTSCDDQALASLDAATRGVVEAAAREWIWRWTGRRLGLCSVTLRPCGAADCFDECDWSSRVVHRNSRTGGWTQSLCGDGCRGSDCSCSRVCEIVLPGPVHDVTEVRLDGVVRDVREYRVDDSRTLVRVGELQPVSGAFAATMNPNVATLGQLRMTGWDGVNPSDWLQVLWSSPPHTMTVEAGDPGDTLTVLFAPGDSVTWPSGWSAVDTSAPGSTAMIVGNTAVAAGPSARLTLTLTAGNTTGTITGTQGNPTSTGFSIVAGASRSLESACWPTCQDMSDPAGDPDTWSVTYRIGTPVPMHGQLAAGALANEIAKAVCGDKGCRLPARVQSVARQGVTETFIDPTVGADSVTGIWLIDSFVSSMTAKVPTAARVFSPDVSRGRRTTWEG